MPLALFLNPVRVSRQVVRKGGLFRMVVKEIYLKRKEIYD